MKPASIRIAAATAIGIAISTSAPGVRSQPAKDPDWPCVQVLVPALSPGQIWGGPPLDEADPKWIDDPRVASLKDRAVGRATPVNVLDADVAAFAKEAGAEREQALTALFARVFSTMDDRRSSAINAIKRYARQQRELQAEIAATLRAIDAAPKDSAEATRLNDRLGLLRRILDERRRSLTAVCEQPIDVERRLGEVARVINAHLE